MDTCDTLQKLESGSTQSLRSHKQWSQTGQIIISANFNVGFLFPFTLFLFFFFNSRWKLWLSFHLVRCITSSFNSDLIKTLLKLVKPKLTKLTSVCMLAQKLMLGRILLSSFLDGRCFDRWSHLFGSVCSVFLGKLVAIWGWFDSEWKAAWQSQLPRMTRE